MEESLNAPPEEIPMRRRVSNHLPCAKFGVERFRRGVAYDNYFSWSFDNLDGAKTLCSFLVTKELGVWVIDTVIRKKVFELAVPPT